MPRSEITSNGLKRDLQKKGYNKPQDSIPEYIWNGFDAGASFVDILINRTDLGGITSISIVDNGKGIEDPQSFRPVYESGKPINPVLVRKSSNQHGINGLGRLTFFTFAAHARWETIYRDSKKNKNYKYEISIKSDDLRDWKYENYEEKKETKEATGTKVSFSLLAPSFSDFSVGEILESIKDTFGWFLELNEKRQYRLRFDGKEIDYSDRLIQKLHEKDILIGEHKFDIKFILWSSKQKGEYSKYYFSGSDGIERFNETTTLNQKADEFFHSLYIFSSFFDPLDDPSTLFKTPGDEDEKEDHYQPTIFNGTEREVTYNKALDYAEKYLHNQRTPFIAQAAEDLVKTFQSKDIFPSYSDDDEYEVHRKNSLHAIVKQLYRIQPKIFTRLTIDQKKIFIRLLDAIDKSGDRGKILSIISEVISLDSSELCQLEKTLKTTTLSNVVKTIQMIEDRYKNVVKTIQMIEDRYKVVKLLKKLVYQEELNAKEPNHLQQIVESNYWIFGEKYHLVSAEEPNFEEALRGYVKILTKDDLEDLEDEAGNPIDIEDISIDHKDKYRQMDIFMSRKSVKSDSIDHVVVELKHPRIKIGENQVSQVKKYMRVIQSKDTFNARNSNWEFLLIGNKVSDFVIQEQQNKGGEDSLIFSVKNYKIYVKTWSEIFNEFEIKHSFLQNKLKIERDKLMQEEEESLSTADEITAMATNSSASLPGQIATTKKQRKKQKSS